MTRGGAGERLAEETATGGPPAGERLAEEHGR